MPTYTCDQPYQTLAMTKLFYSEYNREPQCHSARDLLWHCGTGKSVGFQPQQGANQEHIDGLVQDCSNSIAIAMELLKSCAKPSIFLGTYCN